MVASISGFSLSGFADPRGRGREAWERQRGAEIDQNTPGEAERGPDDHEADGVDHKEMLAALAAPIP